MISAIALKKEIARITEKVEKLQKDLTTIYVALDRLNKYGFEDLRAANSETI